MKIIKKIFLSICLFICPLFLTVSCFDPPKNNEWDTVISIQTKFDAFVNSQTQQSKNDFLEALKKITNKLKNENPKLKSYPDVRFEFKAKGTNESIVQNVSSQKTDLGIASIAAVNSGNFDLYQPVLQTTTNSFVFDPLWSEYLDGSQNDPLIKIAKKTNEFLKINPYKDLTKDDWNNIIFKKYYEFEKKVNFYRGVIWICGSEATKNKIKKAWKEKDWNTFRNFGIVSGGEKEAGSWKLPANLLKKHFTKNENQPFRTLEQDKLYNPGKYKVNTWYTARDLGFGEYQNFHIAFEDEGAFAWTNKWPIDKENNEYFQAQGLEILTVTNPLKYDIGIFRKNFSYDLALLVSEAFGIVAQNKKDTIGPSLGYNGYEVITKDRANKEVVQLYKKFISTK